jgi:sulfur transfer protein SufE/stress-induced morphogen
MNMMSTEVDLGLTPTLEKYVTDLRNINDDRLRYQQLLYLASKCEGMSDQLKVEQNKVPGCLSTVYVHATVSDGGKVFFVGDSDALLTKGLVALLVNGLSGCTPEQIQNVKPEFIQHAGIGNSLTPGRNNGFLNMLKLMKAKALLLSSSSGSSSSSNQSSSTSTTATTTTPGGKIFKSIQTKLSLLKPSILEVVDESSKHAGHAGVAGSSGETHFNVKIVAACFEGLSAVQRHKMVYMLLSAEMSGGVHALSISAKTPTESTSSSS